MNMRKFWIKMNILYEKLMLLAFILAMLIVVYGLYDSWYVFHSANDKSVLRYKPKEGEPIPDDIPITDEMVAWITMDDTNIDYPVMQGEDNYRFLNVNPYGEYSLSGSIFLDSRNSADFSDAYSILYGHHMEYGVMFGALDEYLDKNYLLSHSDGTLLVGRDHVKSHRVKAFASVKVNIFDKNEIFDPEIENLDVFIRKNAKVYDDTVPKSDRVLALSTCTEPVSQNRLLVFCYIYD